MKPHREFQAAAERRAVDCGDHRLRAILYRLNHLPKVDTFFALAGSDFAELLDVGAGDESLSRADQRRAFDRIVVFDLLDGGRDAFGNAGAQRVNWRVVDGDDPDFAIAG